MEQLVHIFYKQRLKMKYTCESDLFTSRSTSTFKRHQEIFTEFVVILKAVASNVTPYGTINLDPDIPAVIQIWPLTKGIICNVNQLMDPFLKIFGL